MIAYKTDLESQEWEGFKHYGLSIQIKQFYIHLLTFKAIIVSLRGDLSIVSS